MGSDKEEIFHKTQNVRIKWIKRAKKGKKCVVFDFEQNEQEERIKCKELHEKFIHSTKWIIYGFSRESGAESWFCELIQFVSKTVNNFAHVRHIIWRIRVVSLFFARSIENDNFFHFIQRTTVFLQWQNICPQWIHWCFVVVLYSSGKMNFTYFFILENICTI